MLNSQLVTVDAAVAVVSALDVSSDLSQQTVPLIEKKQLQDLQLILLLQKCGNISHPTYVHSSHLVQTVTA
jgi:hypothetical protein